MWRLLQIMFFRVGTLVRRSNPRGKSAIYWRECVCGPSGSDSYCNSHMFSAGGSVCGVFCKPCFFVLGPWLGGRIQEVNRPYIGGSAFVVPAGPIPIAKPYVFSREFRVERFSANYAFFRFAILAQSPNPKDKSTIYWMCLSVLLWILVCPPHVSCSPPGEPLQSPRRPKHVKPYRCGTVLMYLFFRCSSGFPFALLKFRAIPWGAPQEPEEAPSSPSSSPPCMPSSLQRCSCFLWCSQALEGASDSSVVSAGASVLAGTVVLV